MTLTISLTFPLAAQPLLPVATRGRVGMGEQAGREQAPIRIRTNEVALDIVVTDKKGRPVRDLQADDFEIYEDNVRQAVTEFRAVSDAAPGAQKRRESGVPAPGEGGPVIEFSQEKPRHLVTLLFDHLPVQRVQPVRDAAFQFIDNTINESMEVRVMTIGRQLYLIEHFTRDKRKLREAIEIATSTVEKSHEAQSKKVEAQLQAAATVAGAEGELARLSLETLERSARMAAEVKSPHHIFSLIPFARAHRLVAGRKMALYFSDGLYLPPGMGPVIRNAIHESTQANLSFYSINIRDLLVGAGNQVSRLETSTVINQTRRAESAAFSTDNANSFNAYRISDRASTNFNTFEYIDRRKELSKQGPLSELTEGTGGFLLRNSNDLNGALKRIGGELGNYYAVSYLPLRQEADGKFRTISVKIRRSGVTAKTRQGYFALPASKADRPELSYESPLLAALNGGLAPHDFPFDCGAYRFESRDGRQHIAVNASLPLAPLIHEADPAAKAHPVSFTILGLIRDEKGEIVQQFSEPHDLTIPIAAIDEARRSNFTLTRHFWLPAGNHTLETVVQDIRTSRFSTSRQRLRLASGALPGHLQTGNLILVREVDELDPAGMTEPDYPLIVGNRRIVPNLESQFALADLKEISFSLPVFPGAGLSGPPTLEVELQRGDEVIARTSPTLPPADAHGRIFFIAGIGTTGLKPGDYVLRARVRQENEVREEQVPFNLTGQGAAEVPEKPEEVIASSLVAADRIGELTLHALKSNEPARIDVDDLLRETRLSAERMQPEIAQYTYSLRKVRRTLNQKGQIRQEEYQDFEAYPVNGRHALIKFAENGSRLALQLIELNRRVATDLLIKSSLEEGGNQTGPREQAREQIGYWGASLDGIAPRRGEKRRWLSLTIDPETFFDACQFSTPRLAVLEGRQTLVIDFNPREGYPLAPDRQWINRLTGTMWFDMTDMALVRIEGQRKDKVTSTVNFVYQQQQLAPGIWAPSLIRINSGGDESLFDGLNWDAWFEFSQFKRFDTSRIEQKIGE